MTDDKFEKAAKRIVENLTHSRQGQPQTPSVTGGVVAGLTDKKPKTTQNRTKDQFMAQTAKKSAPAKKARTKQTKSTTTAPQKQKTANSPYLQYVKPKSKQEKVRMSSTKQQFDQFAEQTSKQFADMQSTAQKNMDAVSKAGQTMSNSMQSMAQIMFSAAQNNMQNSMKCMQSMMQCKDATQMTSVLTDSAKTTLDSMMKDSTKLAETYLKMTKECSDPFNKTWQDAAKSMSKNAA